MIFYSARFKWPDVYIDDGEAFYIDVSFWKRGKLREFGRTCQNVGLKINFLEGQRWIGRSFVVRGRADDVQLVMDALSRWSRGEPLMLKAK